MSSATSSSWIDLHLAEPAELAWATKAFNSTGSPGCYVRVSSPSVSTTGTISSPSISEENDLDQDEKDFAVFSATEAPLEEAEFIVARVIGLANLKGAYQESFKRLTSVVLFMLYCDHDLHDICTVLAHAVVYFRDISKLKEFDGPDEAASAMATLTYVAHAYVLDEDTPLADWHTYLFKKSCSLKALDGTVMEMMKLRNYILRIEDAKLQTVHAELLGYTKRLDFAGGIE